MAIAAGGDTDDVVSEINVTPLVDVMLVLLVVFLVTAPLLTNGIRVNLPKTGATAPPEEQKALSISVDARGKVYLDHAEVPLARLEGDLREAKRGVKDLAVHLNADTGVNYGIVAKVMSAVDRAGVNQLSVLTVTE